MGRTTPLATNLLLLLILCTTFFSFSNSERLNICNFCLYYVLFGIKRLLSQLGTFGAHHQIFRIPDGRHIAASSTNSIGAAQEKASTSFPIDKRTQVSLRTISTNTVSTNTVSTNTASTNTVSTNTIYIERTSPANAIDEYSGRYYAQPPTRTKGFKYSGDSTSEFKQREEARDFEESN